MRRNVLRKAKANFIESILSEYGLCTDHNKRTFCILSLLFCAFPPYCSSQSAVPSPTPAGARTQVRESNYVKHCVAPLIKVVFKVGISLGADISL